MAFSFTWVVDVTNLLSVGNDRYKQQREEDDVLFHVTLVYWFIYFNLLTTSLRIVIPCELAVRTK